MMLPSSAEVQATKVGCLSVAGSPFKADTVVCVYQEDFFCVWVAETTKCENSND